MSKIINKHFKKDGQEIEVEVEVEAINWTDFKVNITAKTSQIISGSCVERPGPIYGESENEKLSCTNDGKLLASVDDIPSEVFNNMIKKYFDLS